MNSKGPDFTVCKSFDTAI